MNIKRARHPSSIRGRRRPIRYPHLVATATVVVVVVVAAAVVVTVAAVEQLVALTTQLGELEFGQRLFLHATDLIQGTQGFHLITARTTTVVVAVVVADGVVTRVVHVTRRRERTRVQGRVTRGLVVVATVTVAVVSGVTIVVVTVVVTAAVVRAVAAVAGVTVVVSVARRRVGTRVQRRVTRGLVATLTVAVGRITRPTVRAGVVVDVPVNRAVVAQILMEAIATEDVRPGRARRRRVAVAVDTSTVGAVRRAVVQWTTIVGQVSNVARRAVTVRPVVVRIRRLTRAVARLPVVNIAVEAAGGCRKHCVSEDTFNCSPTTIENVLE